MTFVPVVPGKSIKSAVADKAKNMKVVLGMYPELRHDQEELAKRIEDLRVSL